MKKLKNIIGSIPNIMTKGREKFSVFISREDKRDTQNINAYFFAGMAYSCSCFDNITLPKGYNKVYVEWLLPEENEIFSDYCKRMSEHIPKDVPIVLVGYSFGGFVAQQIASYHNTKNIILISTIKSKKEIPQLFKTAKKIDFANLLPQRLYNSPNLMINIFNKYIYNLPSKTTIPYLKVTNPVYLKWAMKNAYEWVPPKNNNNMFHIHGSKDQVFSAENLDEFFSIKGADHLMVVKRGAKISKIIAKVLNGW